MMDDPKQVETLDQSIGGLLPRAKAGCNEALSELFQQLQDYYLLVAKNHLANDVKARINPSDIVQETLAKAAGAMEQFRGNSAGEFRAWLKTILQNEIKEQQRKQRQQKRDVAREANPAVNDESRNLGFEPSSPSLTPQSRAIAEEELARLRGFLSTLPEDYQTVIQLRSLERKEFKQVAQAMNRSSDAVAKLWYRAILALQKAMKSE